MPGWTQSPLFSVRGVTVFTDTLYPLLIRFNYVISQVTIDSYGILSRRKRTLVRVWPASAAML